MCLTHLPCSVFKSVEKNGGRLVRDEQRPTAAHFPMALSIYLRDPLSSGRVTLSSASRAHRNYIRYSRTAIRGPGTQSTVGDLESDSGVAVRRQCPLHLGCCGVVACHLRYTPYISSASTPTSSTGGSTQSSMLAAAAAALCPLAAPTIAPPAPHALAAPARAPRGAVPSI